MRNVYSAILTYLLSLVLHCVAEPGPGPETAVDPPSTTTFADSNAARASSSPTISPITNPITQATTFASVVPYSSLSSSELSYSSPIPASSTLQAVTDGFGGTSSSSSIPPTSMATSISPDSGSNSNSHRNLVIILSAVLGFVGILLITGAILLIARYLRNQSPFAHRGASPINDEEIASWRGTSSEQKQPPPYSTQPSVTHDANTVGLAQTPGWIWPTSTSAVQPATPKPASMVPDTPSLLAKAPNARAGLTDETVPGAVPFIPPVKRQSSRLSKAPRGHARSKSRRSSLSAKSMWSYKEPSMEMKRKETTPTWFDPEDDHNTGRELRDIDTPNDSPGTSIFDGLSAGGLSPRPKSRPRLWETEKEHEHGRTLA
ncbi:hypothetical protein LSUB1_G000059 [Lachnellula subtilissima]|uniref:Mid2 domain-containing protein n=1 Tax=Lachnellula subtilissima TaxID=602034 RepID=A0A8H8S3P2_9HELO|nr:hypothetical protein LSUB1_G000059 [Lachnellula subtilissima]